MVAPLSAGSIRLLAALALVGTAPVFAQSADDGFDPNVDGRVFATTLQADGRIIVGGAFTNVGGIMRSNLARLNVDGRVDTAFAPSANGGQSYFGTAIHALAVQPDGKILVGGNFTTLNGQPRQNLGRLNPDGSLDTAFNPGASQPFAPDQDVVWNLFLQPDGKMVVDGIFTVLAGQSRTNVGRLNPDGTLDTTFTPQVNGHVTPLAIQIDGRILVYGYFGAAGEPQRLRIGRLETDGRVDRGFSAAIEVDPRSEDYDINAVVVQTDGKILVGGEFGGLAGWPAWGLGRLNADGSPDTGFNPNPRALVTALALQADGKIVASGFFTTLGGQPRNYIGRLNHDGSLDTKFNPGANSFARSLVTQPDGKILVGGEFTTLGGQTRNHLGRLHADGSVDATFNPGADNEVNSLAVQPDARILAGGYFTTLGGQSRSNIARLNPDGTLDKTFNPGADDFVYSVALQSDGKILIGGEFTMLAGQPRKCLGRLNPDGSVDSGFNPAAEGMWPFGNPEPQVFALTLQPDGKILVGGYFTNLADQPRSSIGRLNADGSLDAGFDPGAGAPAPDPPFVFPPIVSALVVQPDGRILVGGSFATLGGQSRTNLGRVHADGSLDNTFSPIVDGAVSILVRQPDGKILLGGGFEKVNGASHEGIARLHPDGSLDADFIDPRATEPGSLAVQADGMILVVGDFTTVAGQPRNHLARLNADGTLDLTFDPGADRGGDGLALQTDGKILVGGAFSTLGGQPRSRIGRLANAGAALQSLSIDASGSTATWRRSGTAPEVEHVTLEKSDDGTNYVLLGRGVRVSGGWQVAGLSLPTGQGFYLRARGRALGAGGLIENVGLFWRLPPPFLSVVRVLGNCAFQFSFTNTNAVGFTVLASTNVALPVAQWEVLGTPVSVGGSQYEFNDPDATNHVRRFYQLRVAVAGEP